MLLTCHFITCNSYNNYLNGHTKQSKHNTSHHITIYRIITCHIVNTSWSYRSLTYHSLNVLIPITVISLREHTLVISSQERILTLSFYQSITNLSLSTHNLIVFFHQSFLSIALWYVT